MSFPLSYQTCHSHPHWQRTESHGRASLKSALHLAHTIPSNRSLRVALVAILIFLTEIVFLFVLFLFVLFLFVLGLFPHANVGG
jgi:hypothetical protein